MLRTRQTAQEESDGHVVKAVECHTEHLVLPLPSPAAPVNKERVRPCTLADGQSTLSSSFSGSPNRNTLGLSRRNAKQMMVMECLGLEGKKELEAQG